MSRLFSQHRSVAGGHLINQPRIFVSHGHKDDEFTQLLVDDLHRAGAVVWVDVAGITHGNFMQRTDEALTHYGWLVLLLTDNALASPYVKDEVCAALHWVKQGYMYDVVPVLSAPCTPGTIPPQWDVLQRHDAIQGYAAALAGSCEPSAYQRGRNRHRRRTCHPCLCRWLISSSILSSRMGHSTAAIT